MVVERIRDTKTSLALDTSSRRAGEQGKRSAGGSRPASHWSVAWVYYYWTGFGFGIASGAAAVNNSFVDLCAAHAGAGRLPMSITGEMPLLD
jgi:hypothetical protein